MKWSEERYLQLCHLRNETREEHRRDQCQKHLARSGVDLSHDCINRIHRSNHSCHDACENEEDGDGSDLSKERLVPRESEAFVSVAVNSWDSFELRLDNVVSRDLREKE